LFIEIATDIFRFKVGLLGIAPNLEERRRERCYTKSRRVS